MSAGSEAEMPPLDDDYRPFYRKLTPFDWGWAAALMVGAFITYFYFSSLMDIYELSILFGTAVGLIVLGWYWKPFRLFMIVVTALTLAGIALYDGDLARGQTNFFLNYLLASQSAILWMCTLYVLATLAYWAGLIARSPFAAQVGTATTWAGSVMGTVGLGVRWRESYLLGPEIGYIPISNLYEVFIQFAVITALLYLYYEQRYRSRAMGGFVLTVITAAVIFLLWYTFGRQGHEIQPLVPALQSWWMKVHVPTNFVAYGAWSIAAMLAVAWLVRDRIERKADGAPVELRLPSLEVLDDIMYKAIALGFLFFTIATVLGAMWAAEAWGGYWSWDPKETWSLITWLCYAAWLHVRLTKGLRGPILAWWAIAGFFITLFTFVGVNMFLSGLHSYGTL